MFQLRHPRPVQDAAAAPAPGTQAICPRRCVFCRAVRLRRERRRAIGRSRKPQFLQERCRRGAQSSSETPSFHAARAIITIPMGDGAAMGHLKVRRPFDGVAGGVPEIEQLPCGLVAFVGGDEVALQPHAARYELRQRPVPGAPTYPAGPRPRSYRFLRPRPIRRHRRARAGYGRRRSRTEQARAAKMRPQDSCPADRLTAVLPPTDASTAASRVVGTCMNSIPRR